jgi:hypothetical protein
MQPREGAAIGANLEKGCAVASRPGRIRYSLPRGLCPGGALRGGARESRGNSAQTGVWSSRSGTPAVRASELQARVAVGSGQAARQLYRALPAAPSTCPAYPSWTLEQ